MRNKIKVSLIISTYNWHEALELVLLSVINQSVLPNEVIIADDGSTSKTKDLIEKYNHNFPTEIIHLWHKDQGFRLSTIRNKAICKAKSEYIIQIDGDIILHKHFIKDHLRVSKKGCFITGSRVLMSKELTFKTQKYKNIKFKWFSKGLKNRFNAMYISFLSSFFTSPTKDVEKAKTKVRGCNMSFWKQDLIEVNGYNEDMVGWGREDSELSVRLVNAGKIKNRIKFGGIQYHQYHKESSREGLNKNDEILEKTIKDNQSRCNNGLTNYC